MGFNKAVGKVADAASDISEGFTDREGIRDKGLDSQRKLNYIAAISGSIFHYGWRPLIGWTLSFGWIYQLLLFPFLYVWFKHEGWGELPKLDLATLAFLTGNMLGIAWLRSKDKKEKYKFWKR